ncbi:MAG: precorrin-6y C5,15-methyltransferase (decarboxylating) subunit CbiE [Nitrospinae bacterium]|nr:precorrin-6y C5,15-methyltransferase (decarboxylating) subunit CbiE [Nitrospinota bacterium]
MAKLYCIGIGYKPIDKRARDIMYSSEVILTSERLFEVFKGYEDFEQVKDRIKIINSVDETMDFIKSQISQPTLAGVPKSQNITLLASGDPLFFGIGIRAVREFGKDTVEILPDLSSVQMAFSRIKEQWDDAFLMSLHSGPDPEKRRRLPYDIKDIPLLLASHYKIAILTDRENNPAEIAKTLLKSEILNLKSHTLKMYVCERLGSPEEKITEGRPEEIAGDSFSDPNVVIIQNTIPQPHLTLESGG